MKRSDTSPNWLLIHGAGGGSWQWGRWQRRMEALGIGALTPQLTPGKHGLAQTGLDQYLEQLDQIASAARVDLIVGASMGAVLAWQLAARHQRTRLVLINPPCPGTPASAFPGPLIHWRGAKPLSSTRRHMAGASDLDCYYAHQRWRDESSLALTQAQRWRAAPAAVDTLLIVGDRDPAAANDGGLALARSLAAKRWLIEDADHWQPLLSPLANRLVDRLQHWSIDSNSSAC